MNESIALEFEVHAVVEKWAGTHPQWIFKSYHLPDPTGRKWGKPMRGRDDGERLVAVGEAIVIDEEEKEEVELAMSMMSRTGSLGMRVLNQAPRERISFGTQQTPLLGCICCAIIYLEKFAAFGPLQSSKQKPEDHDRHCASKKRPEEPDKHPNSNWLRLTFAIVQLHTYRVRQIRTGYVLYGLEKLGTPWICSSNDHINQFAPYPRSSGARTLEQYEIVVSIITN
ncbi:hypothetical protein TEA_015310 [Camellia sinensis var. sinensis]|uniref:Uncharacterized protein n=1 Tax=Camellia sinensis var. sinensis TaxID=542762 RepID=A0A4S4EYY0_CAMSN|nr:hypothetical protein TEA_015310 [Camellia sinensis var. sinensis]